MRYINVYVLVLVVFFLGCTSQDPASFESETVGAVSVDDQPYPGGENFEGDYSDVPATDPVGKPENLEIEDSCFAVTPDDFRRNSDFEWGMAESESSWIQYCNDTALEWISQKRFCEAAGLAELILGRGDMYYPLELGKAIQDQDGGSQVFRVMIEMAWEHSIPFDPRFEGPTAKNYGMYLAEAVRRLGRSNDSADQKMFCGILEKSEYPIFIFTDGWDCEVLDVFLEDIPHMPSVSRSAAIKMAKAEWEKIQAEVDSEDLSHLAHEPCGGTNPDGTTPAYWLEKVLGIKVAKPESF